MIRAILELIVIIFTPICAFIYKICKILPKPKINYTGLNRVMAGVCIVTTILFIGFCCYSAYCSYQNHKEFEAAIQEFENKYSPEYWDEQLRKENQRQFEISSRNTDAMYKWLFENEGDSNHQILVYDLNCIMNDINLGYHKYYQPQCGYDSWDEDNRRMYERLLQDTKENQDFFLTLVYNGIIHGQVLNINDSGLSTENYIRFRLSDDNIKNYVNTLVGNCLNLTYNWDWHTSQNDLYRGNYFTICDGFYNGEEQEPLGQLLDIQGLNNGYWINLNSRLSNAKNNEEKLWWLSEDAYKELRKEYCERYGYYDRTGKWNNTHLILNSRIMELAYVSNWTKGNEKYEKQFNFIEYDKILGIYNKIKERTRAK